MIDTGTTALIVLIVLFGLIILVVVVVAWFWMRRSEPDDPPFGAREGVVGAGTGDGTESGPATSHRRTLELPQPPVRPALPRHAALAPASAMSAAPAAPALTAQPASSTMPQPVPLTEPQPAPLTEPQPAPLTEPQPAPLTEPQPVPLTEPRPVPIAEPDPVPAVSPSPAPPPVRTRGKPRRAHTLRFDSAGETSPGPRSRNDDTWLVRHHLLVIADGVGGKPAGKTAADLAVRTLRDTVDTTAELPDRELVSAVELAHNAIVEQSCRDPAKTEMACTLDAASLHPDGLVTGAHVGDSRVYYRPREGAVVRLTADEAVEGALLQSLGGVSTQVEPRIWQRPARLGDRLVLATDGLWSALDDTVVTALITATRALPPPVAARVLVDTGLDAGATDNVTVVVADVVALDPS